MPVKLNQKLQIGEMKLKETSHPFLSTGTYKMQFPDYLKYNYILAINQSPTD